MSLLLAVVAIVGSVAIEVLLTGLWPGAVTFFDLPLIVVLYYAIAKGPTGALLAGTTAGLLQDTLEGTLLGVNALAKALVGYLVGVAGLRFALAPLMPRALVLAAATVLTRFIELGTLAIMGRRLAYSPFPHLLETVLGTCLVGTLALGALRRDAPE